MKRNYFLIVIGIIFWIIFILPLTLFGILNIGNFGGMLIAATLLFYGIFYGKINHTVKVLWKYKLWKVILSVICVVVLSVFIFTGITTTNMICAANNFSDKETTVIVLGCKVNPNGPSLSLLKRLEAAYNYLMENPDIPCILSGGQGDDEHISEAQAMYDWLTERGIDGSRLYMEDRSTSTEENILFSDDIIKREALPPAVTLITNNFHQYRAQKIAEKCGVEAYGVSGDTPLYLLPMYYMRELGGIFVEFCF